VTQNDNEFLKQNSQNLNQGRAKTKKMVSRPPPGEQAKAAKFSRKEKEDFTGNNRGVPNIWDWGEICFF
jgi:hypothetical protein